MIFGVLKDIKEGESRVICTPMEVASIVAAGHTVLVEKDAGKGAGFANEAYAKAGARIVDTAKEMWDSCDFLAKVKEIEASEYGYLREGQMIYCCIHPAGHPEEVQAILDSKCIAITAEDSHRFGSPNCEAAGKQGALFGLESMLTINGGKGKFVGGFAGAPGMNVLILGGGVVGQGALSVLHALGANVTVMDINVGLMRQLGNQYNNKINTMYCTKEAIESVLPQTDMVINCVKWPKQRKDFLITKEALKLMEPGSVLVDISNDDPGAIESSHETHHDNPRYVVNGVVHYCVSN
ncbi:MAG: alanine dehydrogenase, partial [Clostridia bacterium]|nr:alanine dehydrogenase [Clostridia bacterium]